MHRKTAPKEKPIAYQLIHPASEVGEPLYARLMAIIDRYHDDLSQSDVRIALVWCTSWKPDADGTLTLGQCQKATDIGRELAPYDFVILLNKTWWYDTRIDDKQRTALLDHELMHAAIARDKETGEPVVDERGRQVYRLRKHDIEEFGDIVARHGLYKRDLEAFAQALQRSGQPATWVGYSGLAAMLAKLGLHVDPLVIAAWPDKERHEVHGWVRLREAADVSKVNPQLCPSMPAMLAAALAAPTLPLEPVPAVVLPPVPETPATDTGSLL